MKCAHEGFDANVSVARFEDRPGKFMAHITVKCNQCQQPMCFVGLPMGLALNGAAVSVDRTEARLAMTPQGETLTELDQFAASVRRAEGRLS